VSPDARLHLRETAANLRLEAASYERSGQHEIATQKLADADQIERQLDADQPIADPGERAKAVAKELRRRGIWADVHPASPLDVRVELREGYGFRRVFHGATCPEMGPHAIADAIQAEEARLAQVWAGDGG
jgi:hypothetical protein